MLKDLASTLLSAAQTRLALLGNELAVQKHLVLQQLFLLLAMFFCLVLAVLMLFGLALVLWWESRLTVLALGSVVFVGLTGFLYARLQGLQAEPVFAASLTELQEDLRQLRAASGHEEKPR